MNTELTITELLQAKIQVENAIRKCLPIEEIKAFNSTTGIAIKYITFNFLDTTQIKDGENRRSVPGTVEVQYESEPIYLT